MGEKGTRGEYYIRYYLLFNHMKDKGWDLNDGRHSYNYETKQNAHYDEEKQQWIDSKTGKPVSPSGLDAYQPPAVD